MPTPISPNSSDKGVAVADFILHGQTVSVAYLSPKLVYSKDGVLTLRIVFHIEPAPRVGHTLPDWPEALSLRPNLSERAN